MSKAGDDIVHLGQRTGHALADGKVTYFQLDGVPPQGQACYNKHAALHALKGPVIRDQPLARRSTVHPESSGTEAVHQCQLPGLQESEEVLEDGELGPGFLEHLQCISHALSVPHQAKDKVGAVEAQAGQLICADTAVGNLAVRHDESVCSVMSMNALCAGMTQGQAHWQCVDPSYTPLHALQEEQDMGHTPEDRAQPQPHARPRCHDAHGFYYCATVIGQL